MNPSLYEKETHSERGKKRALNSSTVQEAEPVEEDGEGIEE